MKKSKELGLLRTKQGRRIYYKNWIRRQTKNERILKAFFKKFFKKQGERVISNIGKKAIDDGFNLKIETKLLEGQLLSYLMDFVEEGGNESVNIHNLPEEFIMTPRVIKITNDMNKKIAKVITKTTKKRLDRIIVMSIEEGDSFTEMSNVISSLFSDMGKARSTTIARTSTVTAMQTGQYHSYKQNKVRIKIWVAVGDDRTRDSHAMMDGMELPINEPFPIGLMYPGDPVGPAGEVINCRCSI